MNITQLVKKATYFKRNLLTGWESKPELLKTRTRFRCVVGFVSLALQINFKLEFGFVSNIFWLELQKLLWHEFSFKKHVVEGKQF